MYDLYLLLRWMSHHHFHGYIDFLDDVNAFKQRCMIVLGRVSAFPQPRNSGFVYYIVLLNRKYHLFTFVLNKRRRRTVLLVLHALCVYPSLFFRLSNVCFASDEIFHH